MESQNIIALLRRSKPKFYNHNFRKFKLGSNENIENQNLNEVNQSVGVIRSTWKSQSSYSNWSSISGFIYGTGFLVSQNILMTCAHNIYSKSKKSFANQIQFISGIDNRRPQQSKIRTAKLSSKNPRNFATLYSRDFVDDSNSELEPCLEEICLIILDSINCQKNKKFLQIGSIYENQQPIKLKTIGYPSDKFRSETKFQKAYVERVTLNGVLHSIGSFQIGSKSTVSTKDLKGNQDSKRLKIEQIINYTMKTRIGCSGSPILAQSKDKKLYVVGIHTHRGREDNYNSGVYFGTHMIELIKQLQKKLHLYLKQKFPQNKQKISFYCQEEIKKEQASPKNSDHKSQQNEIKKEWASPKNSHHSGLSSQQQSKISCQQWIGLCLKQQQKEIKKEQASPKNSDRLGLSSQQNSQISSQQEKSQQLQKYSEHSSYLDEDYIKDFYNFLSIQKVSSQSKHESKDYLFPSLKQSFDFFNNNLFYAQNPIFLPHPAQPKYFYILCKLTLEKDNFLNQFILQLLIHMYLGNRLFEKIDQMTNSPEMPVNSKKAPNNKQRHKWRSTSSAEIKVCLLSK